MTGAKIKNGVVDSAKVKDGSLTGADLNLGTIGTVPSATKSAKTEQIGPIVRSRPTKAAKMTLLTLGGLTTQG